MDDDDKLDDLPSFIDFKENTQTFEVTSNDNSDAGSYTLATMIVYHDYPDAWRLCKSELEVLPSQAPGMNVNYEPYFDNSTDFLS